MENKKNLGFLLISKSRLPSENTNANLHYLVFNRRAGGAVVSHLALHQWVCGSIPATVCMCKRFSHIHAVHALADFLYVLRFPPCLQNWAVFGSIKNNSSPRGMGTCCVKSGCCNLSADRTGSLAFMAACLNEATWFWWFTSGSEITALWSFPSAI